MKDDGLDAAMGCGNVLILVNVSLVPICNTVNLKLDRLQRILWIHDIFMSQSGLEIIAVTELELNILDLHCVVVSTQRYVIFKQFYRESYSICSGTTHRDHQLFVVAFKSCSVSNDGSFISGSTIGYYITEVQYKSFIRLITPSVFSSAYCQSTLFVSIRDFYIAHFNIVTCAHRILEREFYF